jgi:hypothetical protein
MSLSQSVREELGEVDVGFLNGNLLVLCFTISRCFLFTNRVSACGDVSVFGKTSLIMNIVCSSGFRVTKSGVVGDSRIILLISATFLLQYPLV